ncbi:response regulator [Asticcacaulis sp. SL142]|jgi:two-component system, chemotaxis family, chemotaxis protein CheY|uniref:response regulator n=1 Tax=Asticcacaulis sp. SL142 TaxID=2995155 RepID=UPI00226D0C85|nr:response regulator [Asticcacaulis sp. SL142]WAC48535.1 response regulator [Asticcacaulis sp. SL142]
MTDYSALKILLVEDNQHMRSIVMAILKGTGLRNIREARDGAEALEILRQYDADIAVVDFNMQPIDGVEFTRMLRNSSDSPNPYLPVVMITGHSEKSRVMEARDAGVNEFVVKPLTARALLGRIDTIIMRPRPFIRCSTYFGPDRRRKTDEGYKGPYRRNTDGMF